MATTLLSIQIIPSVPGGGDVIPYVDRAIEIIQRSGVKHQVNALETTMEGELPQLLDIVKDMNDAMVEAECPSIISQIKILHKPDGASMDKLTEKYR
ncbi:thiamine-binding protein [Paenibacillus gansuensis]|uniref:MTH1187 family thiamine-binding protein n=1 Tax=Paenibacillus gansuensis TaxID=306542 RepID=A0ABW5PBJ9_9BACL